MQKLVFRFEESKDWFSVERLTRDAFGNKERVKEIGVCCDEHYLAHTLRQSEVFVPELDYVAEKDGRIVGNIMYSHAYIEKPDKTQFSVLTFGPLSVLPDCQKQGIGSALVHFTLKQAAKLGYPAVVIFGHPEYYPRFGFRDAKCFAITTNTGKNFPAFMALELQHGALDDVNGQFYLSPLFDVNIKQAQEFDRKFQ